MTEAQAESRKRVWIQLAQTGTFKGHPQGPFDLTPQTFASIVRNFEHDGIPIPIDAEHASEMAPNTGSIPVAGAPAMGWVHQLDNRGQGGLWGQVEWLDPAKTYIKEGRYRYISPAIRFKSKDRVSGAETGPRMSSAGITNTPFLPDMRPLTARAQSGEPVYVMSLTMPAEPAVATDPVLMGSKAFCYSAHEYMPKLRSALKLSDLATARECSDHLERLRDHFDAAGGDADAMHHGVQLSDYMRPMRDMVGANMGMSWDDVLDTVEALIDDAMDEHVEEYHADQAPMSDDGDAATMSASTATAPAPAEAPLVTAAEPPAVAMTAAPVASTEITAGGAGDPPSPSTPTEQEEVTTMTTPVNTPAATAASPAPAAASTVPGPTGMAEVLLRNAQAEVATLTLTISSVKAENQRLEDEVIQLRAWKAQREEQEINNDVAVAFATYKETKGLRDDAHQHLVNMRRSMPEAFHAMYPAVPMSQRHLLQTLAAGNRVGTSPAPAPRVQADQASTVGDAPVTMSMRQLSHKIAREQKLPLHVAQLEAEKIINNSRNAQRRTA